MFSFDVVPGKVAKDLLDGSLTDVVDLVEDAYRRHDAGHTVNPDSYFLRFPQRPDARIIALPAFIDLPAQAVAGIKWISSFPGNVAQEIPRASAVLILNDYATGYPIALLEAAGISAARTAASAAVAARTIARSVPATGDVSIIGAGVIARTILRYLTATGYPIHDLRIFDLHEQSATNLARYAQTDLGLAARTVDSATAALAAQTVITATTASAPYLDQPLRPGQVALNISLRDFAPAVILSAQNYLDDIDHCLKANTSPHLAEQQVGNRDFIDGTLADLLAGRGAVDPARPVIFSPFGLGVLDLAVGHHVLRAAQDSGMTVAIADFFGETRRW